tara:strand:+ start:102 stop:284 length:183 start_codon:yes stop_codon:yes gene_type:complete
MKDDPMAYMRMMEIRALKERIQQLEAGLQDLIEIADISDGPAAAFYKMMAKKALNGDRAD